MSEVLKKNGLVIVSPGRDVVASMAPDFKTELQNLLKTEKPEKMIIDLSGVEMVDSVGIGVIIAAYNSLREIGGVLEIANASADIHKALIAMRLNHHFAIERAVDT